MSEPTKICAKCSQSFQPGESIVNALEKRWHTHCFVCHNCKKPFQSGSLVMENGHPVHEDCSTSGANILDGTNDHPGDCPVCGKSLLGTEPVVSLGDGDEKYHQKCFVCFKCKKPFQGTTLFQENGKPCHVECMGGKSAAAQTAVQTMKDEHSCNGCGKPFEASSARRFVEGMGHFHPECFVCTTCRGALEGRFYVHPTTEEPTCKPCIDKVTGGSS
mmetsp:Transcript_12243/g.19705  ORF Transcript_12243/g.19705 Transcript_12243/m.19705 type:complete len:217 (-) Transcript_12243:128-778(-)